MLDSLITSKTRIKLLLKFFQNPSTRSYLRSLAEEFKESTNSVRVELNKLTEAGILESQPEGNTIMYQANHNHPIFPEITKLVEKYTGINQIVGNILSKLGDLKFAFLTGDYAKGRDTGIIDLVLVGEINGSYLDTLVDRVEKEIGRKINCHILSEKEYEQSSYKDPSEYKVLIF